MCFEISVAIENWFCVYPYVLSLSVRSLSIAINEYDDIRHTHDDVTVRIRWVGRYLTSTISKIKRFE